ncbi:hypothetical protein WBJ53_32345 (plasmid) [Spirosoma sp. SC4-14]|uniref:hypothetical protein n=1 Tax=Spirosoma sp. SC4-14 TaxID=3128900 RepID=UPI0030CB8440
MAISRLPDDPPKIARSKKVVPEKKIQEFINKGGKPTEERGGEKVSQSEGMKGLKLNLMDQEINAIKVLRDKRPARRGRKITISLHDWVIEAVREKIQREQKKHGLTLI